MIVGRFPHRRRIAGTALNIVKPGFPVRKARGGAKYGWSK